MRLFRDVLPHAAAAALPRWRHLLRPCAALASTRRRALASGLLVLSLAAGAQTTATTPPSISASAAPQSALDAALFYQLLLGEISVRTSDAGTGFSLLLDAARRQRSAQLYRRAVDIALQAQSGDAALAAARAWSQDLPQDAEADRFVLQLLLALNRVDETAPVLRAILARTPPAQRNEVISAIPQTFARVNEPARALAAVRSALAGALRQPMHAAAAWTTLGRMELAQNHLPQALAAARRGHAAEPTSPLPALLALELLQRGQVQAETLVRQHLLVQTPTPAQPHAHAVQLAYAQTLLQLQRTAEAKHELEQLTARQPELASAWLLLASLQVQTQAWAQAGQALQTFLSLADRSNDQRVLESRMHAYLLQAQVAEGQNELEAARAWLDRIEGADTLLAVQLRRASLLARQGDMTAARALLRGQPQRSPEDARLLLLAEAQLLRDFQAWQSAFEVYAEAVQRFPADTDLLYNQAMMAEKTGAYETMERLLRQLIAAQPQHYHAHNALGYSLADRNTRLPEAKALIERALQLAPTNPYILDSMGWVEFRLGNLQRALSYLQTAHRKDPSAEIAAHLGEVLWSLSRRDEALQVWRAAWTRASDNETLQETLQRLQVQP